MFFFFGFNSSATNFTITGSVVAISHKCSCVSVVFQQFFSAALRFSPLFFHLRCINMLQYGVYACSACTIYSKLQI